MSSNPFDMLEDETPDIPEEPVRQANPKNKKKEKKGKKSNDKSAADIRKEVDDLMKAFEDDVSISEAPATSQESGSSSSTPASASFSALLATEAKHLKPDVELKRMFGSKTLRSEGASSSSKKGPIAMAMAGGGSGRQHRFLKSILATPKDATWPPMPLEDLRMEFIGSKNGFDYFRYAHGDRGYDIVTQQLMACVQTQDPNAVAQLLARHPYHPESLLQMSEILSQYGQHAEASELVERCLYALECAWHPAFDPTKGTCRMDHRLPENATFFEALTKAMHMSGRRGCPRTALELSKLIYSLDPTNDPSHALLSIDHFAVRSRQFGFLVELAGQSGPLATRGLDLMPSVIFNVAVAKYYLSREQEKASKDKSTAASAPTSGPLVSREDADGHLRSALTLWPFALPRLLEKCGVDVTKTEEFSVKMKEAGGSKKGKERDSEVIVKTSWEEMLRSSIFTKYVCEDKLLDKLVDLAVDRNFELFKTPEILRWLRKIVYKVCQTRDSSSEEEERCVAKRQEVYGMSAFKAYAGCTLSEITGSVALLPAAEMLGELQGLGQQQHAYNPIDFDEEPYFATLAANQHAYDPSTNPLMLFLQTLLPWTADANRRQQDQPGGGQQNEPRDHPHDE